VCQSLNSPRRALNPRCCIQVSPESILAAAQHCAQTDKIYCMNLSAPFIMQVRMGWVGMRVVSSGWPWVQAGGVGARDGQSVQRRRRVNTSTSTLTPHTRRHDVTDRCLPSRRR
jgi:hypothetical protein